MTALRPRQSRGRDRGPDGADPLHRIGGQKIYEADFGTDGLYTRKGAVSSAGLAAAVALMVAHGELPKHGFPTPAEYVLPAALGGLAN